MSKVSENARRDDPENFFRVFSNTHRQKNSLNCTLIFHYVFDYFASSLGHSDLRNDSVITQLCNLRLKCLKQNV